MKKIFILFVILLSSCSMNEEYIVKEIKEEIVNVKDEYELVYLLDQNVMNDKMNIHYRSEKEIDLKKAVKLLSFINPFDLKVKKYTISEEGTEYYVLEVEYMEEYVEETKRLADAFIKQNINNSMSTREKTDMIHDYILKVSEYNEKIKKRTNENEVAFQVYGVLHDNEAVCTGYARTYLLLCRMANIPVVYVPSDVMNHSFNLIYNEGFQFVDVTWDETNNEYHNVSMDAFFENNIHEMDDEYDQKFFMDYMIYMYQLNR